MEDRIRRTSLTPYEAAVMVMAYEQKRRANEKAQKDKAKRRAKNKQARKSRKANR